MTVQRNNLRHQLSVAERLIVLIVRPHVDKSRLANPLLGPFQRKLHAPGSAEQPRQTKLIDDLSPNAGEVLVAGIGSPAPGFIGAEIEHLTATVTLQGHDRQRRITSLELWVLHQADCTRSKLKNR